MHPNVYHHTIYNSQDMKATEMMSRCQTQTFDRWLDEEDVAYINIMEYYSSIKKNNVICSNMDGPRGCHNRQSKSERERQIAHDIHLKYDTNELVYETVTKSWT